VKESVKLSGSALDDTAVTEPTVSTASTREHLDRALVHGLAWSAAGRWLSQVLRWAATVLTARLLLPEDYGIAGIAMLVVGLMQYFAEFGFGAAIVQHRSLPESTVRQIGGAAVMISLALALLMVAVTPLITSFYDQPALGALLPVLSVKLVIDGWAVVPRSVLARDLQFKKLSLLEGVESAIMAAATVGTAWLTRSYWAFVAGSLVSGAFFTVAATSLSRIGPSWPRAFSEIRPQVKFGVNLVISRVAWYAYTNADFAIVGKVMNAAVLGLYSFAWNIASVPAEKLSGLVLRVAPSILSAVRTDTVEMRRYYLMMVRGVALVAFPVAVGLALVSRELVDAVFGQRWEGAVVSLQLLALFFGVRAIATLAPVVMIASGKPQVDRNYSLTFLLILPPLFLLGSRWGIAGVAVTWLLAYPLLFAWLGQRWVLRRLEISVRDFFSEMWPAIASVVLMAAVVTVTGRILGDGWPALARLFALSAVGAVTYIALVRALFRSQYDAALLVLRNRGAMTVS
jgi:O-antigen/teichoic acid export membrane protein